ncbi:MAG: ATP synthase F1 subunit epsilon [Planctomycetota bacterium]|jgi:F-type H+-transporting ATPase subunit epsilon
MHCRIVTPDQAHFDGEADAVVLPAVDGELGVWPKHTSMLAQLGTGSLRLKTAAGVTSYALSGGFAEIGPDSVLVAARRVAQAPADLAQARSALAEARAAARAITDLAKRSDADANVAWQEALVKAARAGQDGGAAGH